MRKDIAVLEDRFATGSGSGVLRFVAQEIEEYQISGGERGGRASQAA